MATQDEDLTLRTICSRLAKVAHKWNSIGVQLGVPFHLLKSFENDNDPLSSVVNCWLQGNTKDGLPKCWKSIICVLMDSSIEETGLADEIIAERFSSNAKNQKRMTLPSTPLTPEEKDVQFLLQQNLQRIIAQYASYVECIQTMLEEKGVRPTSLHTYLSSLSALESALDHNQEGYTKLNLLSDKKVELLRAKSIPEIVLFLTTECASFLNHDIFQNIIDHYDIKGDDKLEYPEHLKTYIHEHKISEPAAIDSLMESKSELVLRYDIDTTCRLAKVAELKVFIARLLGLLPSAVKVVDIKDGCTVTLQNEAAHKNECKRLQFQKELLSLGECEETLQETVQQLETQWVVERSEIELTDEEIGRGGWATVSVATFRGMRVAAKCIHNQIISDYTEKLFRREMVMASRIRHPNLLQFIGAILEGELIILTELMPTNLRKELESRRLTSLEQAISIGIDVAKALNYLHLMQPHPFIHRDISSANILLQPLPNGCRRAKVSDYGTVNIFRGLQTMNPGNPTYSAPESNDPTKQSPKMDIFSFGILLVEMLTREFPDSANRAHQLQKISHLPPLLALVQKCLKQDRNARPSASDIITELDSKLLLLSPTFHASYHSYSHLF